MAQPGCPSPPGGGRWRPDGRFTIEPQSGTWVIVDSTQTNEFGLPLVRGPFPSLGAAREAIEAAREAGPVESPLADRIERARVAAPPDDGGHAPARPAKPSKPAARPEPAAEPEPAPPPDPAWFHDLLPADRRKARTLIARLEDLIGPEAEAVARAELAEDQPALARLAIERRLRAIPSKTASRAAVRAVLEAVLTGGDDELDVTWRLVDRAGRPIETIEPDD
jgi:hypothetical protein